MKNILPLLALGAALLAACSGKDVYDPSFAEKQKMAALGAGFVKKYGPVASWQSWDLAGSQPVCYLPSARPAGTRAAAQPSVQASDGNIFDIDPACISYFEGFFDGPWEDDPLYFFMPEGDIRIVPIYQGGAKSVNTNYFLTLTAGLGQDAPSVEVCSNNKGIVTNGVQHKAKVFTVSGIEPGEGVSWFFRSNKGGSKRTFSSLEGNPRMVLCPVPVGRFTDGTEVPAGAFVIVVKDKNDAPGAPGDAAYLVYGLGGGDEPALASVDEPVAREVRKRYMLEDLGDTYDFDFNDVVIDVEQRQTVVNAEVESVSQTAVLRHLGNMLSWNVKVGDTWLYPDFQGGRLDADFDERFAVTGWDPEANNVTARVKGRGQSSAPLTIVFPKPGSAPVMLAVPVSQTWMAEGVSVPKSWWTE